MEELRLELLKTLYCIKKPIQVRSNDPFYGYSYDEVIVFIGKKRAKKILDEYTDKLDEIYRKRVDLKKPGLYTVVSKKLFKKLFMYVGTEGYVVFNTYLQVVECPLSDIYPRRPMVGEFDMLWENLIANEKSLDIFVGEYPMRTSFITTGDVRVECLLYELVEIMGIIPYGKVEYENNFYLLPLFLLDKVP